MRTEAAPGSDPEPGTRDAAAIGADDEHAPSPAASGNDEQLRRDVPPHW